MDGPRDYHTQQSQSERGRQIPYVTYMWNLKYNTNDRKQTYKHREQTCGCQGEVGVVEGRTGMLGLADANCYIQDG